MKESAGFNFLLGVILGAGFSFVVMARGFTLIPNKDLGSKIYIIDRTVDTPAEIHDVLEGD